MINLKGKRISFAKNCYYSFYG